MRGSTHAWSGRAAWLLGCAAATGLGVRPHPVVVVGGVWIAAAAAYLPDIDHPGSVAARSLGSVSLGASRLVARAFGHRGLTHSAVAAALSLLIAGCLGMCAAVLLGAQLWPWGTIPDPSWRVGAVVLGGVVLIGAFSARRRWIPGLALYHLVGLLAACLCGVWVGAAAATGYLAALAGDASTVSGIAFWAPFSSRRIRILPARFQMVTGHWPELIVVASAQWVVAAAAAGVWLSSATGVCPHPVVWVLGLVGVAVVALSDGRRRLGGAAVSGRLRRLVHSG